MRGRNPFVVATGVAVIVAFGAFGASESYGESLRGAIQRALEDHPRAMKAEWNTEAVDQESKAVRGRLLPQVSVEGSFGPEYRDRSASGIATADTKASRQARVVVRQLLYDGLLTPKEGKAAEMRVEAAKALEADVDENLALDVAEAYLGGLRAREQVSLAKANVGIYQDSLEKTSERFEAGRGQRVDVDLVEARLGLAQSSLETRTVLLKNANVRYLQLVGKEPSSLQWPNSVPRDELPSTVREADLSGNYSRMAAEDAYDAARLDEEAARGTLWPRIELELGGGLATDVGGISGDDSSYTALVVGTWDLYTGGTESALRNQRIARRNEAAGLVSETVRLADEDFGRAVADRDGAREREDALAVYAGSMSNVVDAYEAQLEIGSRAILNVLDVKNEEFRAKSALLDVRFEKIIAEYRMLAAQGKLVKTVVGDFEASGELAMRAQTRTVQTVEPGNEDVEVIEQIIEVGDEPPKRKGLFGWFRSKKDPEPETTMVYDEESGNMVLSRETPQPGSLGGNKVVYVEWEEPDELETSEVKYTKGPITIGGNVVRYEEAPEVQNSDQDAADVQRLGN